jgi:urease accessory protein
VAGDRTSLDLLLEAGTCCLYGTQSSTKVYRSNRGEICRNATWAAIGPGALLVFMPDPVQAFAHSRYQQRQHFRLAPGASLVLVDALSAGRAACGERWAFTDFNSRNEVFAEEKCVFLDSLRLESRARRPPGGASIDRFQCLASLVVMGPAVSAAAAGILAEVSAWPVTPCSTLVGSASALPEGAVVRIAGEQVERVTDELRRLLRFVTPLLGEDPWARKGGHAP